MTNSPDRFSRVIQVVAVACAVVTTVLVARSQLLPPSRPTRPRGPQLIPVGNWTRYLNGGHRIGPADAKYVILEFADFECPACKEFAARTLHELRVRHAKDVAVVFHHWPLPYHRFAIPAAMASECAAEQGRFTSFHDAMYRGQDSLGLKPFRDFARDAEVPDLRAFDACTSENRHRQTVDSAFKAAVAFGGDGTPTIGINGKRFAGVPSLAEIEAELK